MCLAKIRNRFSLLKSGISPKKIYPANLTLSSEEKLRSGTIQTMQYQGAPPLTVFVSGGGQAPKTCPECGQVPEFKQWDLQKPVAERRWGFVCSCGWKEPHCEICGCALPWDSDFVRCRKCANGGNSQ